MVVYGLQSKILPGPQIGFIKYLFNGCMPNVLHKFANNFE